MEDSKDTHEVPVKITDIVEKLKPDYAQEEKGNPDEEFKKNIRTGLFILRRAELWASGLRGTKEEANQLMQEGFKKMLTFYPEEHQINLFKKVLDEEQKQQTSEGKPTIFAELIKNNRSGVIKEDKQTT